MTNDVHFAKTDAVALQKLIAQEWPAGDIYNFYSHNVPLFDHDTTMEHENPDGSKVSGRMLRGTLGLYFERDGQKLEAQTACREFIADLRLLLDAAAARARV